MYLRINAVEDKGITKFNMWKRLDSFWKLFQKLLYIKNKYGVIFKSANGIKTCFLKEIQLRIYVLLKFQCCRIKILNWRLMAPLLLLHNTHSPNKWIYFKLQNIVLVFSGKGIESLPQTKIFWSLYLWNLMLKTFDISN